MKAQSNEISNSVIGAAIEVHRHLGPGLLESAYEACLCRELSLRNIPFERQVPLLVVYIIFASLAVALAGAALNVFYRDVSTMLPILLQLMMYGSPVIYPMSLVRQKLLIDHVAGHWSDILYRLYTFNPLAGIIDAFQRTVIYGQAPDWDVMWPGLLLTLLALPLSYVAFKRAEMHFADIV